MGQNKKHRAKKGFFPDRERTKKKEADLPGDQENNFTTNPLRTSRIRPQGALNLAGGITKQKYNLQEGY